MATWSWALTGNDANPGTLASPKRHLANAVALASAGDTVLGRGGTYDETLINNVPSGTSWSTPVRIANYPGETVWMTPTSSPYENGILWLDADQHHIEFDGINLDARVIVGKPIRFLPRPGAGQVHSIRFKNAEVVASSTNPDPDGGYEPIEIVTFRPDTIGGFELQNLVVHGGGTATASNRYASYGIYLGVPNSLVEHCDIYDNQGAGIVLFNDDGSQPDHNIIRNNRIHDQTRYKAVGGNPYPNWGVIVVGSHNQIYNNLIYAIHQGPVTQALAVAGDGNQIWHNTLSDVGDGIYLGADATNTELRNNIVAGQTGTAYADDGTGTTADHNLVLGEDPGFVDAAGGDFRLASAASGAYGAGVALPVPTTDITGAAYRSPPAIGAYELVGLGAITGTGSVRVVHPTLTGAGDIRRTGVAAVAFAKPTVSGTGTGPATAITGTGSVSVSHLVTAGSGASAQTAGTLTISHPSVTGTGSAAISGVGVIAILGPPALSGSGSVVLRGTGAEAFTRPSLAASGTVTQATATGTGTVTIGPLAIAMQTQGALAISGPALSGAGSVAVQGTGAAAISRPSLTATGQGVAVGTGTETLSRPSLAASGTAAQPSAGGIGAVTIGAPAESGAGIGAFIVGAVAFTPPAVSGAGDVARTATGAETISAPALAASGAVAIGATGSVAIGAPALAAVGEVAAGGVTIAKPATAADGVSSVPTYTGDASVTIGVPTFTTTGVVNEGSITIGAPSFAATGQVVVTVPIRRVRQWLLPPSPTRAWSFVRALEVVTQAGVGTTTGAGSDPQLHLELSTDGGRTWGPERSTAAGKIGQYTRRARFRNLGRYRTGGVARVVVDAPVPWALLTARGDVQEGTR